MVISIRNQGLLLCLLVPVAGSVGPVGACWAGVEEDSELVMVMVEMQMSECREAYTHNSKCTHFSRILCVCELLEKPDTARVVFCKTR